MTGAVKFKEPTPGLSARSLELLDRELTDWLKRAPDRFLACRDLGHQWPTKRPKWFLTIQPGKGRVYKRQLMCGRCSMIRNDYLDARTYERLGSTYTPPPADDGGPSQYYLPKGTGRLERSDLMLFEIETQPGGVRDETKAKPRRKRKAQ